MYYTAILTREDNSMIATFPDCPGCVAQADEGEDILVLAAEALAGWLEVSLEAGDAPARPRDFEEITSALGEPPPDSAGLAVVPVPASIAARLHLRWARQAEGLSQAQLAKRLGVTRQQAANYEATGVNPRLSSLERVADALGYTLDIQLVRRERPSAAAPR